MTDCTNNLKRHVTYLTDEIGERHIRKQLALHRAANYISHQWELMGYEVERQPFTAKGVKCENLEVTKIGKDNPDDIILICAHYDTAKGCPGANDNASGIAAMLEIAGHFSHTSPSCSVRFVALANEKPPFYGTEKSGSWVYAHRASHNSNNIHTAIILESLGYYSNSNHSQLYPPLMRLFRPKQGNFLAMASNLGSMSSMRKFAKCFKKHSRFRFETMIMQNFLPWVKWSDSSPFWLNGYHAFMLSDTAQYRYPFYNSSRDTAEKIDYQCLTFITDGLTRAIEEYANKR